MVTLEQYQSRKGYKKFDAALSVMEQEKSAPGEKEIIALVDIFDAAYQQADDETLERLLQVFSYCSSQHSTVLTALLGAIEWRPNWGEIYDPKMWREDVNESLHAMLKLPDLLMGLQSSGYSKIAQALGEFFDNPIHLIEPVLDSLMSKSQYLPLLVQFLLDLMTLLQTLSQREKAPETTIEALLRAERSFDIIYQQCREKAVVTPRIVLDIPRLFKEINELP